MNTSPTLDEIILNDKQEVQTLQKSIEIPFDAGASKFKDSSVSASATEDNKTALLTQSN